MTTNTHQTAYTDDVLAWRHSPTGQGAWGAVVNGAGTATAADTFDAADAAQRGASNRQQRNDERYTEAHG